ncbi:MAG: polyphosphate kinase 1 [Acutalibacteraceae bacterium]
MDNKVFINRELSWIDFNLRVLEEAQREENPLFERLGFISIFESNFDEFFRVRVGSLHDKLLVEDAKKKKINKQLNNIYKKTALAVKALDEAYSTLSNESAQIIHRITAENITPEEYEWLKLHFEREIAPIISPFIVEKKHPFPFFENGRIIVGVTLTAKNQKSQKLTKTQKTLKFGFIPVFDSLPSCITMKKDDGKNAFILIEDLLLIFAKKIFHKFNVSEQIVFTIIRNADIDENEGLYDYDIDFRDTMSKLIEVRRKLAPVELKYCSNNCENILTHLKKVLCLKDIHAIGQKTPLSMNYISDIKRLYPQKDYPEYYYKPLTPQYCKELKKGSIIKRIQRKDVLLSYPFDDVTALINLLHEAANDKNVRSIDISLYRVAKGSKIVHELMFAAENGKKVSCMLELRARFDEENNIDWSRRLEEAGCKVYYGLPHYKVHCKLIHIGMKNGKDIVHIGTGNFNERTSKIYTDLSLLTAHEGIVREVRAVFNSLKNGRFIQRRKYLLVAPLCMKKQLMQMMDEQIELAKQGKPAEMTFKFNSLTDKELMNKLIEASCAGVKIKMLIRGICCLIPGVAGKTENIEIRSIVGRFLEHSRIYVFGVGKDKKYFISSADFMTRNTDQRVEVATPVYDFTAKRKLNHILSLGFADNTNARIMQSDGSYIDAPGGSVVHNMQSELYEDAYKSAANFSHQNMHEKDKPQSKNTENPQNSTI